MSTSPVCLRSSRRGGLVAARRLAATLAVAALGLVTVQCSTNPATGKQQLNLVGEAQEIAMGQQADQQLVQQMGLYGDAELQAYVQRLGESLARDSERPDLPWTFRVIDDPAVNAFALPGGYIYVTRGILGHLRSEAELAGVLGHEIGHVTARHSVNQISKQQLAQIGLVAGMIAAPELQQYGDLASTGLGLLFLKFGRDAERQADELGFRYMASEGYAPGRMGEVFNVLERVSAENDGSRLPGWLSTHPDPGSRARAVESRLAENPEVAAGETRAGAYLRQIEGMEFGADPREGFFLGDRFYHPELAFSFALPRGWNGINQRQAVIALSPDQDARFVFTLADGNARAAAQEFFRQPGVQSTGNWLRRGGDDTISSTFQVSDQAGNQVRGGVAWSELGGRVYRFLGFAAAGNWGRHDEELARAAASLQPLRDRRLLEIEPRRLEIIEVPQAMTLAEFDRRWPSSVSREKLALLNHVQVDATLPAGFLAKRVVGQDPATLG